jgi:hypothetical protein
MAGGKSDIDGCLVVVVAGGVGVGSVAQQQAGDDQVAATRGPVQCRLAARSAALERLTASQQPPDLLRIAGDHGEVQAVEGNARGQQIDGLPVTGESGCVESRLSC